MKKLAELIACKNAILQPPPQVTPDPRWAQGYCCGMRLTRIYGNTLRCPQCGKTFDHRDPQLVWKADPPRLPHQLTPQQAEELKRLNQEIETAKGELVP